MPDTLMLIIIFGGMLVLLFYARKFRTAQMHKAGKGIMDDLRNKGALDAGSAIELPYAKRNFLKIGLRDDRPKIIQQMVQMGVVLVTEEGRFYLNESRLEEIQNTSEN